MRTNKMTKGDEKHLRVLRFKDLKESFQRTISEKFPLKRIPGSSFVIFVDALKSSVDAADLPVLNYNSSNPAFVISRSPMVLNVRGRARELEEENVYFISRNRAALFGRKTVALGVAAALVLALTVCFLAGVFSSGEVGVEKILATGYQSIQDMPEEYLELVPGLSEGELYADAGSGVDLETSKKIESLVIQLDSHKIYDMKLFTFYDMLLNDPNVEAKMKDKVFYRMTYLAEHYGRFDIIEYYLDHPEDYVKNLADCYFKYRYPNIPNK